VGAVEEVLPMMVGAALVELHVHGSRSLKQKRGVVKSIVSRLRSRFNVSVAEVGGQDTWQRAVLGLAVAGSDRAGVRRVLERAVSYIESMHLAEIRATDVEILDLPYTDSTPGADEPPLPWEEESEES
jgi:uncharacterized protein YlxP (DUF503 family)